MAPPGLSALGAKGSVRDRLTPPGRVEGFRPRELYSIAALARYGAFGAISYTAFGGENLYNRPAGVGNASPPLVAGATTFPPQARALWVLSHGAMPLQESIETYSAPCKGGSPAQPG